MKLALHIHELLLELSFDAAKLFLGGGAAGASVVLDLAHLFERGDEMLVCFLERFEIDDAALAPSSREIVGRARLAIELSSTAMASASQIAAADQ